ncbi:CPBP family intramembrane metalloprotease [Nocardioides cavernae]|uniref:CPBP family intramembrane metalloprotease n=1 Tax=Nocardioides cavernae TaxID=1921566 RepID=A0ABR8NBY3_9ACTN|nr:CPBP family intramembrane glutamic endopeptidase [Nocardioides cavernae]MBD3925655.1 CPBP family intramembrane metalloprotease [Nocardioides cavernae]MBM7513238.1 membrane protease YdiL (CAAX protease family) [Nocardioides cavernae]
MSAESTERNAPTRYRVQPSIGLGVGIVIVYMAICFGIQLSSGIEYQDFFDTADNAYRTAVLSLAVCSVLLAAFVVWSRWDIMWRDPGRLAMSTLMRAILIMFVAAVVIRLAGLEWGDVPGDLLLAIACTSVLVGFAEEILFRGIFLRCMRTHGRPEGTAALWTAIAFGLFHLPNVFMGTGAAGLSQIVLAGLSGAVLYLWRRNYGYIIPAMIAHGLWDFSTFLEGNYGRDLVQVLTLLLTVAVAISALVVLIRLARNERNVVVTPHGVATVDAA